MPSNIIPDQSTNIDQMLDGNYLHGEQSGGSPYIKELFEAIVNYVNTLNSEDNSANGATKIGVKTTDYTYITKASNSISAVLEGIDTALGTLSQQTGGGDPSQSLQNVAEINKIGGSSFAVEFNRFVETFADPKIKVLVNTNYTGGTQLNIAQKVVLEDNDYRPFFIVDPTNEKVELVWFTALSSGSTGSYTYGINEALSNTYATTDGCYIVDIVGDIDNGYLGVQSSWSAPIIAVVKGLYANKIIASSVGFVDLFLKTDPYPVTSLANWDSGQVAATATSTEAGYVLDNYYFLLVKKFKEFNDTEQSGLGGDQTGYGTASRGWYLCQANGNASHAGTTMTISFDNVYDPDTNTWSTTIPDLGADIDNYYVYRVPYTLTAKYGGKTDTTSANLFPYEIKTVDNGIPYPEYIHSYWPLNELTGNAINIKAGSSYNFTEVGTVPTAKGKIQKARGPFSLANYFTWSAGGSSSTVYDTQIFAVDGWFKTAVTGARQIIITKSAVGEGWVIEIDASNHFNVYFNAIAHAGSVALTDNLWHHFLFCNKTISGSANDFRIYIDGSLAGQWVGGGGSSGFIPTTNDLFIGKSFDANYPFQGLLDSVAYWNTVPTTWAEVEAIVAQRYANGVGRPYGANSGIMLRNKTAALTNMSKFFGALQFNTAFDPNDKIKSFSGGLII